jgi:rubrerythrin
VAKTDENLQAAFAGESQANRKYLAFAKVADQEGLPNVARLFRAAAEAETVHAHNHLRAMGGIGKTADNLRAAIQGETYEFTDMYPAFIALAEKDKNGKAGTSFKFANGVEKVFYHAGTCAGINNDSLQGVFYKYGGLPHRIYPAQAVMAYLFTPTCRFVRKLPLGQGDLAQGSQRRPFLPLHGQLAGQLQSPLPRCLRRG